MEQLREESGAARSPHLVHVLPRDDARAAALLAPALERVDAAEPGPQVLIACPDRDAALRIATHLNALARDGARVVPVSAVERAARRLTGPEVKALAATPADLLALVGTSALNLASVRAIAVLWGDEQVDAPHRAALESVLSEVPREADRLLLASALGDDVETLITSYMWKARRLQHAAEDVGPVSLTYVVTPLSQRAAVVRMLLDQLNPDQTRLWAATPEGARDAADALAALGYAAGAVAAQTIMELPPLPAGSCDLLVLWDAPNAAQAIAAHQAVPRTIALVEPSGVAAFLAATGGGATAMALTPAPKDAHATQDALREEVRSVLKGRPLTAEILTLEPLLAEADAVQLAAAALRLLEGERIRHRKTTAAVEASAAPKARPAAEAASGMTLVFLSVGERDGARPGDLVGAITGETGIDGSKIGKIELRDSHALVEIGADVAAQVVEKLTGTSIKGRKITARIDRGRPEGSADRRPPRKEGGSFDRARPRGSDDRRPPRREGGSFDRGRQGDGGGGGDRRGPPKPRGGFRRPDDRGVGERRPPPGGRTYDRSASPARRGRDEGSAPSSRTPRAMHEGSEWAARGDRLSNSRRRRPNDA